MQERLSLYLKHKSLSYKDFEILCGLSNGTAARLRPSTRQSTLDKIANSCDLNIDWLLTGEGEMLNPNHTDSKPFKPDFKEERVVMVPLVHIDSVGGMDSQNLLTSGEQYVERLIPFTNAQEDDRAIMQSGTSMIPTIPPGSILHIRKVHDWREYFGYGNDFVLWLKDDRRITKQVLKYKPDPKNYITCHSYKPEVEDEELPKSMIREVWKIVDVLIAKGW